MQTLDRTQIEDALFTAGLDEDALYEGYSGRAMYGAECFGITGSDSAITKFMIALAADTGESELAMELADSMRTDNMGLDKIAYFPGYTVAEES